MGGVMKRYNGWLTLHFGKKRKDDTVDDAIRLMNTSEYGNMACLFTSSGASARKFRDERDALARMAEGLIAKNDAKLASFLHAPLDGAPAPTCIPSHLPVRFPRRPGAVPLKDLRGPTVPIPPRNSEQWSIKSM